jgi:methylisocitrate lyase
MLAKIKAAVDARVDPDLVIMARTDALATHGLQEAIERGNLYREAGADLIFVEAPRTVEEMRRINSEIKAPTLANNLEGGKSPLLPAKELEEIGYNVVVFPVSATYAVTKTISERMFEIKKRGTTANFLERMTTFTEFNSLIGLDSIRALEQGYEEQGLNTVRSGK